MDCLKATQLLLDHVLLCAQMQPEEIGRHLEQERLPPSVAAPPRAASQPPRGRPLDRAARERP
eukprot:14079287-Alexandrium_andersonii.AAC.1